MAGTSTGVRPTRPTLVDLGQPLPGEDADISAALARVMKKSGVKVKTGVRVTSLKRTADGIETSYEDKGAQAMTAAIASALTLRKLA